MCRVRTRTRSRFRIRRTLRVTRVSKMRKDQEGLKVMGSVARSESTNFAVITNAYDASYHRCEMKSRSKTSVSSSNHQTRFLDARESSISRLPWCYSKCACSCMYDRDVKDHTICQVSLQQCVLLSRSGLAEEVYKDILGGTTPYGSSRLPMARTDACVVRSTTTSCRHLGTSRGCAEARSTPDVAAVSSVDRTRCSADKRS